MFKNSGLVKNDLVVHNALCAVTAEFIEGPLMVNEFTRRVTKAGIDLMIDCPKPTLLEKVQAEGKIQDPS